MRWGSALWGLIGMLLGGLALAEETLYEGPVIEAVYVETPPVIDGVLDDACWERAYQTEEFFNIDRNRPPTDPTRAFLCVDQNSLYVAFHVFDDPADIVAYQTKRGGSMRTDDRVIVMLDPVCRHQETYQFFVNPLGTQGERLPSSGGSNVAWRGVWEGTARRVENGWIVETIAFTDVERFFNDRPTLNRTQTLLTANYDFTPERSLSGRLIERDGKINAFLAWRFVPLNGRSLYLFFGDPNASETETRLQAKFLWPL